LNLEEKFLHVLLREGSISFGNFKLKSGRVSPYFVNLGKAMSRASSLREVSECYASKIERDFQLDEIDFIFGPAYKGIPLASSVALELLKRRGVDLRWGYNRKEVKKYGDLGESEIVGDLRAGDKVLVIDDVLTTGETKLESFSKLEDRGAKVIGLVVGVDREESFGGLKAREVLESRGIKVSSILGMRYILEYLRGREINGKTYLTEREYRRSISYLERRDL